MSGFCKIFRRVKAMSTSSVAVSQDIRMPMATNIVFEVVPKICWNREDPLIYTGRSWKQHLLKYPSRVYSLCTLERFNKSLVQESNVCKIIVNIKRLFVGYIKHQKFFVNISRQRKWHPLIFRPWSTSNPFLLIKGYPVQYFLGLRIN